MVLRQMMSGALAAMLAVVMAIMLGIQSYWIFLRYTPPHIYLSAWSENPRLAVGEVLRVRYIFERIRYCDTALNLFIIRRPDNSVVWRLRTIGGAALLGRREVLNVYQLPPEAIPGTYVFRTISHATCVDGSHSSAAPDVIFVVEKGGRP